MRAASAITCGSLPKSCAEIGMLVFVEMEIALGLLIFLAEDAVGRGELGHDQAASAKVADEAAEDGVGDAGHGGEDGGGGDGDVADLRDSRGRAAVALPGAHRSVCADRAIRVVPELLHGSYSTLAAQPKQSPRRSEG